MKLTIHEDREQIRRYAHVRPAPRWGGPRCGARCPGTLRHCTLKKGHTGVHVAHGWLRRVVAVWDEREGAAVRKARSGALARRRAAKSGLAWWAALAGRLVPSGHTIEGAILFVFAVAMAMFGLQWVLRIIAGVS